MKILNIKYFCWNKIKFFMKISYLKLITHGNLERVQMQKYHFVLFIGVCTSRCVPKSISSNTNLYHSAKFGIYNLCLNSQNNSFLQRRVTRYLDNIFCATCNNYFHLAGFKYINLWGIMLHSLVLFICYKNIIKYCIVRRQLAAFVFRFSHKVSIILYFWRFSLTMVGRSNLSFQTHFYGICEV